MARLLTSLFAAGFAALLGACDDKPAPAASAASAASATAAALTPGSSAEPPKRRGPPQLAIDEISVKIGYSRVLVDKPEGAKRLADELDAIQGELKAAAPLIVEVARRAQLTWVTALLEALGRRGVARLQVRTPTRSEFPAELEFVPMGVEAAAPCSVVAMVLEDRATAVWRLSGGVASKRARGLAGPDLTATGDTLERFAKSCKDSSRLFVAAAPIVEWGLVYDLAGAGQVLPKAPFQTFSVLPEPPTPGHKVELK